MDRICYSNSSPLKWVILLTVFLSLFSQCLTQKKVVGNASCATKYPILFVHGVSLRDDVPLIKYWSQLPRVLEKNGAKVYLSNQDAFNSHAENAIKLRERVLEILYETNSEKINIIAHSKGGIESRYMISKLDMADKVASLTTLATPHRGSFLADTILNFLDKKEWLDKVIHLLNAYGHLIGDEKPNALLAAKNLTLDYMQDFNGSVPNSKGVYYQSYGGIVTKDYPFVFVRHQSNILFKKEGLNDGSVSLNSYQWGDFQGIVPSEQEFGVSHFDIAGMKFVSKQSTFDAEGLVIKIAIGLKERGF